MLGLSKWKFDLIKVLKLTRRQIKQWIEFKTWLKSTKIISTIDFVIFEDECEAIIVDFNYLKILIGNTLSDYENR